MTGKFDTIDGYIDSFSDPIRSMLTDVRAAIHRALPDVEESISYDMCTFGSNGRYVVYLAGWKRHISLHAVPDLSSDLDQALATHRSGRGTVKFPTTRPVPVELVERVVLEIAASR